MKEEVSTKQLAEILTQVMIDEPYFNKEVMIPKIKAIITGFRLKLSVINYNAIKDPSQTAKLIRSVELHNLEKVFWMEELKKIVGKENVQEYYDKLNKNRIEWNGK
jgi:hypothetical protein